ncbi:MAG: DUF2312 domain-containing protein [Patescibacteria group bacterium]|nr:DUF2312 domain-containing protein [Patescibacteria group bacterium]
MTRAAIKEKPSIAEIGGNIQGLKEDLVNYRNEIIKLKEKRAAINADIKAIMENAESKGIPKKALRWALNYYESTPEQREGLNEGYSICLEAWGMPNNAYQSEMFSA